MQPIFAHCVRNRLLLLILLTFACPGLQSAPIGLPTTDLDLKSPRYEPAVRSLRENDFNEALRLGAELLTEKPDDASAHLLRALAFVGLNSPRQAMDQAALAAGHEGQDAVHVLQILATTYARSGRFYPALACLSRAETIAATPGVKRDMAQIYLRQGRAAKARPLLASLPAGQADPETLSRACLMLGDLPAAQAAARDALKLNPKNTGALLLLGTAQLLAGETEPAESAFHQVQQDSKDAIMVGHFLALAALARRDFPTAMAEAQAVLKKSPKLREAHIIDGLSWHMQARFDRARQSTALALADSPSDATASLLMAAHWLGENRKDEARRFLPGGEPVLFELAHPSAGTNAVGTDWSADEAGRFTASIFFLSEGLARDALSWASDDSTKASGPAHPFLVIAKARAELALGRRTEAIDLYTALAQKNPGLVTPWIELAQIAATDGQPDKTREYLQQAVSRPGKSLRLQLVAGELAYKVQLYDLAEACFRRAVAIDPQSAIGHNQLAWTLAAKLHRPDDALPIATKAWQLAPTNSNTIDTLAWVQHLLGQPQKAAALYQPLLKTPPYSASTLFHMGKVFEKNGQTAIAAELLEKALTISDEFPEALEASASLQALWSSR